MTPAVQAAKRGKVAFTLHSYEHDPKAQSYWLEAAEALGLPVEQVFKTLMALVDDVPVAWLLELGFPTIYRCNIKNPVNTALGVNDGFRDVWIDKAQ